MQDQSTVSKYLGSSKCIQNNEQPKYLIINKIQ